MTVNWQLKLTAFATVCMATLVSSGMPSYAHVYFAQTDVKVGKPFSTQIVVPHGCGELVTQQVSIKIPNQLEIEDAVSVSGWNAKVKRDANGKVSFITYSGGSIPKDEEGMFGLSGKLIGNLPTGTKLYVPVVQHCKGAKQRWTQIPKGSQSSDDLDYPAPELEVVE